MKKGWSGKGRRWVGGEDGGELDTPKAPFKATAGIIATKTKGPMCLYKYMYSQYFYGGDYQTHRIFRLQHWIHRLGLNREKHWMNGCIDDLGVRKEMWCEWLFEWRLADGWQIDWILNQFIEWSNRQIVYRWTNPSIELCVTPISLIWISG